MCVAHVNNSQLIITIAPLTTVCPAADNSALAFPLAVNPTCASLLMFKPALFTSALDVKLMALTASSVMPPLAVSLMSFGLSRVMPLGLS